MFLKLMDANADTIETHFALGSLYRRRGEVERAIRIHQNLLAREALAPEHREQALLALAQDYLRAGLLDRAEELLQQVSEVPRLRASALECAARRLRTPARVAAGARYLPAAGAHQGGAAANRWPLIICANSPAWRIERGETGEARSLLRQARREAAPFPRAAVLRAQIAERDARAGTGRAAAARRTERGAEAAAGRAAASVEAGRARAVAMRCSRSWWRWPNRAHVDELKRLVFAAIAADLATAAPLRPAIETVFKRDATLHAVWQAAGGAIRARRRARSARCWRRPSDIAAASAASAGRSFYWHCPGLPVVGQLRVARHASNCAENPL